MADVTLKIIGECSERKNMDNIQEEIPTFSVCEKFGESCIRVIGRGECPTINNKLNDIDGGSTIKSNNFDMVISENSEYIMDMISQKLCVKTEFDKYSFTRPDAFTCENCELYDHEIGMCNSNKIKEWLKQER